MALNPGRNVGRLSIRVLPDTKRFRQELKNQLDRQEKKITQKIRVKIERVDFDREKVRNDIRRQMQKLKLDVVDLDVRANVLPNKRAMKELARISPTLDQMTVRRLRRDIEKVMGGIEPTLTPSIDDRRLRQKLDALSTAFDKVSGRLENDIMSPQEAERLRYRLSQIKEEIDRIAGTRNAGIDVVAHTAAATTQMRWVARDRFVNLIVRVNKTSVATALTTLAALSGARLSWKWIDSLIDKMKELDRNLPVILGWTTGITSGIGALFAATSGLVGIGQGLFAITPALLVIPGLALNALGSLTALIVAMRNASTELSPLKDSMSELNDIINAQFWGKARQPIIDLVQGLMPQLRNAFADLSLGMGEFTSALSQAFGKELANGRLESIFKGIADGWRVLGTGADGFAGALVSLSNIAATYTPRLAAWFVRQANTFDKWLKAISEDGRLGAWMEDAIDAMYDVWDVTRGLAGVFTGLWKAADAAGSGGLHGFAQMMLEWRRVVHSADFQRGLTAVFKGAHVAMGAFGDAVRAIGRLIADNDKAFERLIGSAGTFLGGLLEGAVNALNRPAVNQGMTDLANGLIRALDGILPHLPALGDTFGNFLGLLGDLGATVLPAATDMLAALMPGIDSIIEAIRPALPGLAEAVSDIVEALAPAVNDLLAALGPAAIDALKLLANALVDIAPLLTPLIKGLASLVQAIGDLLGWLTDDIVDLAQNKPDAADWMLAEKWNVEGVKVDIEALADVRLLTRSLEMDPKMADLITRDLFDPKTITAANNAAEDVARAFLSKYEEVLETQGQYGADALVDAIAGSDLPKKVKDAIGRALNTAGYEYDYFKDAGETSAHLFTEGLNDGKFSIDESMKMWRETFVRHWEKAGDAGAQALWDEFSSSDQDSAAMQELLRSLRSQGIQIEDTMGQLGAAAIEEFEKNLLGGGGSGGAAGGGFAFSRAVAQGINLGKPEVTGAAGGLKTSVLAAVSTGADLLLQGVGRIVANGFATGITSGHGSVQSAAGGVRGAVWAGLGTFNTYSIGFQIAMGIARGINGGSGTVKNVAAAAVRSAITSAKQAAEIRSPSRLTAREIGAPLMQGVTVGINREAAGVRRAMAAGIDFEGMSGEAPALGVGGRNESAKVALHIHNPVVRDLQAEAWDAAQLAGQVI